jgi:hypothetical protein
VAAAPNLTFSTVISGTGAGKRSKEEEVVVCLGVDERERRGVAVEKGRRWSTMAFNRRMEELEGGVRCLAPT